MSENLKLLPPKKDMNADEKLIVRQYEKTWKHTKNNLEFHLDFIKSILRKVHILKKSQLVICLKKKFNIDDEMANYAINIALLNGHLILSLDGYAMTLGFYRFATEDTRYEQLAFNDPEIKFRHPMKNMIPIPNKRIIDCMSLVADMMPYSENFGINQEPFLVHFVTEPDEKGRLKVPSCFYQIAYISHDTAQRTMLQLRHTEDIDHEEFKPMIKRLAIVEDEDDTQFIPYVGFTNIVKFDGKGTYKVIETRKEPWS